MTRPGSKAPKECLSAIQTRVLYLCGSSEVTVTSISPPSFVSLCDVLIQTNVLSAYRSQYITLCQHSSHQMLPTEQFSLSGQTALASATVNDIGPRLVAGVSVSVLDPAHTQSPHLCHALVLQPTHNERGFRRLVRLHRLRKLATLIAATTPLALTVCM